MNNNQGLKNNKKSFPLIISLFFDIIIAGMLLCIFAYFHHVRQYRGSNPPEIIVPPTNNSFVTDTADTTALPPTDTYEPDYTQTPTPTEQNPYYELEYYQKFEDKFTDGEIIKTDTSYRSPYVSLTITECRDEEIGCTYYVADIYIATLNCLSNYFAKNTYGTNITEKGLSMFQNSGAILSINGDYYGARDYGPVIRNYSIYRKNTISNQDLCLLYYNGIMETIPSSDFSIERAKESGVYQCWAFGPGLLDENGKAKTSFQSWYKNISGNNPRSAIGYYEPGHYCFVAIDGRTDVSSGMTFIKEAELMESLGCKAAYNLDGGISSFMVYNNRYVNIPPVEKYPSAPRAISDCIIIIDPMSKNGL